LIYIALENVKKKAPGHAKILGVRWWSSRE